ncbi:MAG TPA: glycosyl hydrolase family 8 [Trebonia sp.]
MTAKRSRIARLAVWLMLTAAAAGCAQGIGLQVPATSFITGYVRPNGRVARPDQGNDTVSEGQAYGLLLAEATGRPALFGRIWHWTQDHLQLPGGLFAYHADAAGHLLSPEPASDADLLIAWALLRYQGPHAASLHREGRRVAAAVLAQEVTSGPGGMPVLTAGPWATGDPASLNPSYWALPALTSMSQLTGDPRWQLLADEAVTLTARLTQDGRVLPPDWAQLNAGGTLVPMAAPNGTESRAEYGLDAERTVVWFAASCNPRAIALAARWWRLLHQPDRSKAQALKLDGGIVDPNAAPLALTAAAAAAQAAGDQIASSNLLQSAVVHQHSWPTYYGGAWAALAPALLNGGPLDPAC